MPILRDFKNKLVNWKTRLSTGKCTLYFMMMGAQGTGKFTLCVLMLGIPSTGKCTLCFPTYFKSGLLSAEIGMCFTGI